jgi:hypothetical protein
MHSPTPTTAHVTATAVVVEVSDVDEPPLSLPALATIAALRLALDDAVVDGVGNTTAGVAEADGSNDAAPPSPLDPLSAPPLPLSLDGCGGGDDDADVDGDMPRIGPSSSSYRMLGRSLRFAFRPSLM